jgi:hypothetical protein
MTDLTPEQEVMLIQYHLARVAWYNANSADLVHAGTAYAVALDACLAAGFDPFHHPAPQ